MLGFYVPICINLGGIEAEAATIVGTWQSGDCTCTLDSDGVFTVSGNGAMADYQSEGDRPWKGYQGDIVKVQVDSGVIYIGKKAFYECKNLTSVSLPETVTCIGDSSFYVCTGLTQVDLPNSLTDIRSSAFEFSGLTDIVIPDSVVKMGVDVFYGCHSLSSVSLPNRITSIPKGTFHYCENLSSITIPDSVTVIGIEAFRGCKGIDSLSISENVVSIGDYAFDGCKGLKSVTIPISTKLENNAFGLCYDVERVHITKGTGVGFDYPEAISDSTPWYATTKSNLVVTLEDGITRIGNYTFKNCVHLTQITIPDTVTSIGDGAFYSCRNLPSVNIPEGVTTIGYRAFRDCTMLTEINIPDNVTSIGGSAFYNCTGLKTVNIPSKVTEIADSTFEYCTSLTEINIPDNITSIGDSVFYGCTGLRTVNIPNSVDSIDYWAFRNCTNLTDITISKNVTNISKGTFENCIGITSISIPEGVTTIAKDAFKGCTGLTSIILPDGLTTVSESLFEGCTNLISVFIPSGVTNIEKSAFNGCLSLTSVDIPDTVISMDATVFKDCVGLLDISMPISAVIKETTFSGCNSITNVILTKGTGIGTDYTNSTAKYTPWYICRNNDLSVRLNDGIVHIGNNAFMSCTGITEMDLPDSIQSIGTNSFYDCTNLAVLNIPDGLTTIGSNAFSYCTSLTRLTVPSTVNSVAVDFIKGCSNLERIYWFGKANSSMVKSNIPSTARVYCLKDSDVHTWCESTGVPYTLLSDEEAEEIINGVLPTLTADSRLFDGNDPSDMIFEVDLGKAPAGATGIKKVMIDTTVIPSDGYEFDGGSKLTIKLDYISKLSNGPHSVGIQFNNKNNTYRSGATITVVNSTQGSSSETQDIKPSIENDNKTYDSKSSIDLMYVIDYGSGESKAGSVSKVYIDTNELSADDYEITNMSTWGLRSVDVTYLKINSSYLSKLSSGTHQLGVKFDNGTYSGGASITVINKSSSDNTEPPEVLTTFKYEFYKDYPDIVIIPVKLNGATKVTNLVIGETELNEGDYTFENSAIVISENYLSTLDPAKYQVVLTFDDAKATKVSNVQIIVYNKAADRAAPYLLSSRIIFNGQNVSMTFDTGEGDLLATNVLALVFEDDLILPTGDVLPFNSNNISKLQNAYKMAQMSLEEVGEKKEDNIDIASPSDAKQDSRIEIVEPSKESKLESNIENNIENSNTENNTESKTEGTTESEAEGTTGSETEGTTESEAEGTTESKTEETTESETEGTTESKTEETTESETENNIKSETESNIENNEESITEATNNFELESSVTDIETPNDIESVEASDAMESKIEGSDTKSFVVTTENKVGSRGVDESLVAMYSMEDYDSVFTVDGTTITLSGDYISSMNLGAGDYLLGAIFDNTEKTTDVEKIILTIEDKSDDDKPSEGDKPSESDKPSGGDKPSVDKPSSGDNTGGKPSSGDNTDNKPSTGSSSGGSHSGSSTHSSGGSSTGSPSTNTTNNTKYPDGSINPNYRPIVPDSNGEFIGSGDDWTYKKPDGTLARNEWIGSKGDWYYFGDDCKMKYDWFLDPKSNKWYLLNRDHDGHFGAAKYGWYYEKQDGKWYFLNPTDGVMLTSWQFINHKWYYFTEHNTSQTYFGDNLSGWIYNPNINTKPYGSMFSNEKTPDNYIVDETGAWKK